MLRIYRAVWIFSQGLWETIKTFFKAFIFLNSKPKFYEVILTKECILSISNIVLTLDLINCENMWFFFENICSGRFISLWIKTFPFYEFSWNLSAPVKNLALLQMVLILFFCLRYLFLFSNCNALSPLLLTVKHWLPDACFQVTAKLTNKQI